MREKEKNIKPSIISIRYKASFFRDITATRRAAIVANFRCTVNQNQLIIAC